MMCPDPDILNEQIVVKCSIGRITTDLKRIVQEEGTKDGMGRESVP